MPDTPPVIASPTDAAGERLLERLSAALAREPRPDIVIRSAIDALVSEVGASVAACFMVDDDARVSRPVYTVNYPDDVLELLHEVPLDRPAISNVALRTGEVYVINSREDASPEVGYSRQLGERMGIHAAAAVPLLIGGRRLGVLVYGLAEPHLFSAAEIALLREVGGRIATAIERARLEEQLARRVEEAELLHAIASAAAGEDDLGRILAAALERLAGLVPFTGGSIALVEDDALVIKAARGPFADIALDRRAPRGRGRTWRVVESGEPFLSDDLAAEGLRTLTREDGKTIRSYLAVPLAWRGRIFGILQVDSTAPGAFRAADVTLMQRVATLLSGPIELALRYADEVQLRHELDEAKGRLEAILEHAPMGVFFFSADSRLAFWNRAALDVLRLMPEAELRIGRDWDDLAGAMLRGRWAGEPGQPAAIVAATQALRSGILVHDFPLRDPEQMLLRIAAPVFESGHFSGHVILLIDVTAERQALGNAELAIAARDRFISIASHELRTPLTSIKGTAQLVLRAHDAGRLHPERLARQLAVIDQQAERLRQLVDDLLDVSRIQSGRIDLRPEPVDLAERIRALVRALPVARRGRVQLDLPAGATGRWDPLRLDQVVMNLLDNALKYSAPETTVDVTLRRDANDAVLTVVDRGIGIPRESQRTLFEPFARAANAVQRDDSGLGLGLFITRQIVERHGGTIAVASVEGEGTTFTVRLPTDRDAGCGMRDV
jgi:signal transduction histidine kinase